MCPNGCREQAISKAYMKKSRVFYSARSCPKMSCLTFCKGRVQYYFPTCDIFRNNTLIEVIFNHKMHVKDIDGKEQLPTECYDCLSKSNRILNKNENCLIKYSRTIDEMELKS